MEILIFCPILFPAHDQTSKVNYCYFLTVLSVVNFIAADGESTMAELNYSLKCVTIYSYLLLLFIGCEL